MSVDRRDEKGNVKDFFFFTCNVSLVTDFLNKNRNMCFLFTIYKLLAVGY